MKINIQGLALTGVALHAIQRGAAAPLEKRQDINWSTVDYSGVDFNTIDWSSVFAVPTPTPAFAVAEPEAPAQLQIAPKVAQGAAPVVTPPPVPNGANVLTLINRGVAAATIGVFENEASDLPSFNAEQTAVLAPSATQVVNVAEGWAGRVQKLTGSQSDPATWGEVTFNGYENLMYFDVSYIRGNNGPVVLSDAEGNVAGTAEDLRGEAPGALHTTDSSGHDVLDATEPFSGGSNGALISFYRSHSDGNGYVINSDSQYVRSSNTNAVVAEFY